LGWLSSSAGYHFCALSAGAGTSLEPLPNFLVWGFADIVISDSLSKRDMCRRRLVGGGEVVGWDRKGKM
jgi:hypothetical protein